MSLSERYIRKLLKQLEEKGIIDVKRTGFNKPNTYKVSKNIIRVPSTPIDRDSDSYHIGTPVPLHTGNTVPPKSTYTKGKDKINIKNFEELEKTRKRLIEKGFKLSKSSPISYKLTSKNNESIE
ncbi:hypothetical protein SDC9_91822 [bioreactor metagenome]|uniref:Uncharacterized protein n=1 Tax=bioreactor metagenome TaxID=1076179 RepID=A0A644ZWL3_9ZZZZ